MLRVRVIAVLTRLVVNIAAVKVKTGMLEEGGFRSADS